MYNVVGQSLVLVLSLIAVRFIFRRLGNDVFGIIFFNITLTAVLTRVLELGASSTIVREVSSAFDSERAYVRDLVRTASFLYWTIGLLLMLFIWITAPLLVTNWINLTTIDPNTAATLRPDDIVAMCRELILAHAEFVAPGIVDGARG